MPANLQNTTPKTAPFLVNGFSHVGKTSTPIEVKQRQTHTDVHTGKHRRKNRQERYAEKVKTNRHLITLYREIGETERADQISQCCQFWTVLSDGKHIAGTIPSYRCQDKLCAFCAYRPSEAKIKRYLPFTEVFLKLHRATACKLNLTQIQIKGETALRTFERLQKSVQKFLDPKRKSGKFIEKHFLGGYGSYETTISHEIDENGLFHFHCHLIIFRRRFLSDNEFVELKKHWEKASPGAKNLWISPIDETGAGFREQLKYCLKPASLNDFTADHLRQYLKLKNRRMTFSFGAFKKFCEKPKSDAPEPELKRHALKMRLVKEARKRLFPEHQSFVEGDCCPICSEPLFELRMTTRELIEFSAALPVNQQPSRA